ncbi:PAT complex subunit CCDC47 isoform X2 [Toxorhynchites rutilus septentrionalis]|nr:PAT complex subunit CCDC47 isoform X2 [Toxorhynchites rutilus septentrionalis]
MRLHICLLAVILCMLQRPLAASKHFEDDDFAEFEDFDDEEFVGGNTANGNSRQGENANSVNLNVDSKKDNAYEDDSNDFAEIDDNDDDEAVVEDEENDFEHFQDEEEFEGFPGATNDEDIRINDARRSEPKLTMAKVPMHFRTHWDSYWMEMLMLAGLLAYFANYLLGNRKNSSIANLWLSTHKSLLEDNFVLLGDDGKKETEGSTMSFIKESESIYTLWCSGRTCCEGMLVELKMIKRQDLVSLIAGIMKPAQDQLHIKTEMSADSMDNFVFCVATKKQATKMFKELNDLSKFCTLVNKTEEKYDIPGYFLLSEIAEASSSLLDSRLVAALNKYSHLIEYIHVSDQYSGPIQQEDQNTLKQPEVKHILHCGFNMPAKINMEEMQPLLVLVFYLMERLKRFRLSKEGKAKSDKNRARVEEEFMKNTHAARAEAAAQRREEKRKAEKEKVLANEDPEKQRRWEEKERKRLEKKRPKMKQLSIKAL